MKGKDWFIAFLILLFVPLLGDFTKGFISGLFDFQWCGQSPTAERGE